LAVDHDGNIVFQGHSGAANLASTPESRLRKNLANATDGCPDATHVCGCFAGLMNDEMRKKGEDHLRQLFPHAQVRAEPDFTAALYASPPGTDICVIAGTGSLVCSHGPDGVVKSGGRGYLLGDYGSGYHFGRDALLHFLDAPETASASLRNLVQQVFETTAEGAIVAAVYRTSTPGTLLAKFSKALAQDAKAGEAYALQSVERNTAKLVDVVRRHVERHMPNRPTIAISLAGGIWKSATLFGDRFTSLLAEAMPDREFRVDRVTRPPLYGAVELAKEMIHGN
jgi:N-acetylglucosamine kinase-like BadF-type ATPase